MDFVVRDDDGNAVSRTRMFTGLPWQNKLPGMLRAHDDGTSLMYLRLNGEPLFQVTEHDPITGRRELNFSPGPIRRLVALAQAQGQMLAAPQEEAAPPADGEKEKKKKKKKKHEDAGNSTAEPSAKKRPREEDAAGTAETGEPPAKRRRGGHGPLSEEAKRDRYEKMKAKGTLRTGKKKADSRDEASASAVAPVPAVAVTVADTPAEKPIA